VSAGVSHEGTAPGRRAFVSGLSWKLSAQLVTQVTRLAVAILLARIMSPVEFGIAGLALVFAPLAYVFTDLGAVLVQQREQSEEDRSTAFWLSIAIGGVLTVVGVLLAAPIARFYHEPQVKSLFMVLSVTFVITAAATTHSALLHRAMEFRRIETANMIAVLGASVVAVVVALLGGGAWAIILQLVANSILYLGLLWRASHWRPSRRFSRASVRSLWSFSASNLGANLLHYFERNTDNLLIGRFLGPASLGVYSIAYNLMLYPVTRFAAPIHQVMFPLLARVQDDDERVVRIWLRVTRIVAVVVAPAMVGLVVVAPELVHVLLGDKWDAAVPVIQILAIAGLVYAVRIPSTSVILAKGRAGTLFRFSLLSAIVLVTGFAITVSWGVNAVAASFTVSFLAMTPILVALAARTVGGTLRAYAGNLLGVTVATAIMAAAVVPLRILFVDAGLPPILVLLATAAAGALVYVPLCLWLVPDVRTELGRVRRAVRNRRERRQPVVGGEPAGDG
jgi:O-antigen/teichoic acid export membrane protein